MGLPWFAFNIKDFIANTKRLNTEAKGAYLLLMLDYYEEGCGPPDDDDILATICELPEEVWKRHRKVIAPMFEIRDGFWRHERIEAEMLEANDKHAKAVAKATAAALARHAKSSSEDAPSKPPARRKQKEAPKTAPSMPEADTKDISKAAHSTLTSTLSKERVVAPEGAKHDDDPPKAIEVSKEVSFNPLGTTLPEDWTPSRADVTTAKDYGLDIDTIRTELLTFHAYNAQHGTFSKNWSATWAMWCARWKEREAAKPKAPAPRVEVNNQPTAENWDRACALWAKGSSSWPYKSLGPEPGQPGCKCPNIILTKHNINPQTGQVVAPSKEPVS